MKKTLNRNASHNAGFTLIELLMVISIISVLFAMSLPSILDSRKAASETTAISTLREIIGLQESFRSRNLGGSYQYATLAQLEAKKMMAWQTPGTYTKSGYTYTNILAAPTSSQYAILAAPILVLNGDRDFAVTNDGFVRWQTAATANPTTVAQAQAMLMLK